MEQYIFAPTVCGAELEEELAAAIEKRMEIFSRASLPGMWKKTDAMNRYAARGSGRKGVLRKILPWVLILAGLFLLIPGLMEPKELRMPLIAGAFFVLLGVSSLLRQRPARRKGSFRQAAAGMLQNTSGLEEASVQVVFDDDGMKVNTQDSTRIVPYDEMEMLIDAAAVSFDLRREGDPFAEEGSDGRYAGVRRISERSCAQCVPNGK